MTTLPATFPLHVRDLGGDAPVLLLHAGILDGEGWLPVAERIAGTGRRPVIPDLRGFGRSRDPEDGRTHVDDLVDLIEQLDLGVVTVVGWSMGGAVAMDLALERPDLVHALGLVCTVPHGVERDPAVQASWEREDELWQADDTAGVIENDLETWVAGPHRALTDVPAEVVAAVRGPLTALTGRAEGEHEVLDIEPPAGERYGELTLPVLAITGELDHADAAEFAADLAAVALTEVTLVEVPGSAHVPPVEHPDVVADAIIGWLDDLNSQLED